MKELILLSHVVFGVSGIISSVWVFVETLNVHMGNIWRIRLFSVITGLSMVLSWIAGGYWYVTYYAADKAIILKGPWPFAHSVLMEVKEHLFFITLILSLYLPIIAFKENLVTNKRARILIYLVSFLVLATALAIEGAGAGVALGVKLGLIDALNAF